MNWFILCLVAKNKIKMDNPELEEAVRFIAAELMHKPDTDKMQLIEKASQKFDLNPLQTEFLLNKYVFGK